MLAIKMTVYRTSDDSALVPSLIRAAEQGKQAVCMVELKARFDERLNIRWSRALEEAGAHVVHGIPGLKTHAKAILVVRRERDGIRHYVMIGTGNFHAKNARLYEDFGLFTTDRELGEEVANLFNTLTGYAHPERQQKVLVAPGWMRVPLIEEIDRTIEAHEAGEDARIAMKMNSLVDPACIEALYRASQAGVPIDLNVRGICCLKPGVPGVSETINVVSVVGRFLEHSRIYSFRRGEERSVYIGSADLMPRNLDTRVELLTPVENPDLQAELLDTLERCLADDTFAWTLDAEGDWHRRTGGERSVHRELMERALAQAQAAGANAGPLPLAISRRARWPAGCRASRSPSVRLQAERQLRARRVAIDRLDERRGRADRLAVDRGHRVARPAARRLAAGEPDSTWVICAPPLELAFRSTPT